MKMHEMAKRLAEAGLMPKSCTDFALRWLPGEPPTISASILVTKPEEFEALLAALKAMDAKPVLELTFETFDKGELYEFAECTLRPKGRVEPAKDSVRSPMMDAARKEEGFPL